MRIEGFQVCPRCKEKALPGIQPESKSTAAQCQKCGATVERTELERLRIEKESYEKRFAESSKGRYGRTGEIRNPKPGEHYIARDGRVHFASLTSVIRGDFEIVRDLAARTSPESPDSSKPTSKTPSPGGQT